MGGGRGWGLTDLEVWKTNDTYAGGLNGKGEGDIEDSEWHPIHRLHTHCNYITGRSYRTRICVLFGGLSFSSGE